MKAPAHRLPRRLPNQCPDIVLLPAGAAPIPSARDPFHEAKDHIGALIVFQRAFVLGVLQITGVGGIPCVLGCRQAPDVRVDRGAERTARLHQHQLRVLHTGELASSDHRAPVRWDDDAVAGTRGVFVDIDLVFSFFLTVARVFVYVRGFHVRTRGLRLLLKELLGATGYDACRQRQHRERDARQPSIPTLRLHVRPHSLSAY